MNIVISRYEVEMTDFLFGCRRIGDECAMPVPSGDDAVAVGIFVHPDLRLDVVVAVAIGRDLQRAVLVTVLSASKFKAL